MPRVQYGTPVLINLKETKVSALGTREKRLAAISKKNRTGPTNERRIKKVVK